MRRKGCPDTEEVTGEPSIAHHMAGQSGQPVRLDLVTGLLLAGPRVAI